MICLEHDAVRDKPTMASEKHDIARMDLLYLLPANE
jgi:hypothetical protein